MPGARYRYAVAAVLRSGAITTARFQANPTVEARASVSADEVEPEANVLRARVLNDAGFALPDAEVVWWAETRAGRSVWRGVSDAVGIAELNPVGDRGEGADGVMEGYLWVLPLLGSGAAGQLRRVSASLGDVLDRDPRDENLVDVDVWVTRRGEASNHLLQLAVPLAAGPRAGPGFTVNEIATRLRVDPGVYRGVLPGCR